MYPISEVNDLTLVFAASVKHLLPNYNNIPAEFKDFSNKWNKFFKQLFFNEFKNEAISKIVSQQNNDTSQMNKA
jgi:hypothetical protein